MALLAGKTLTSEPRRHRLRTWMSRFAPRRRKRCHPSLDATHGHALFEPLRGHEHLDHVHITVAENIGVEARGRFSPGDRDIVENHVMQLLCLTAHGAAGFGGADAMRDEKAEVLRGLQRRNVGPREQADDMLARERRRWRKALKPAVGGREELALGLGDDSVAAP
jgi:hypothetical protein